jgi:hypothetical protein
MKRLALILLLSLVGLVGTGCGNKDHVPTGTIPPPNEGPNFQTPGQQLPRGAPTNAR